MTVVDKNSYKAEFGSLSSGDYFEIDNIPMVKIDKDHSTATFNCLNIELGYLCYVADHEQATVYPNARITKS